MSMKHAILGLVLERPGYPYELGVRFVERVGRPWEANRGQIYQTIDQLEREGLIARVRSKPSARGMRWIYQATARGAQRFDRWFQGGAEPPRPLRDELFVKLALSRPEQAVHLKELLDQRELTCLERIREYSEDLAPGPLPRSHRTWKDLMSELVVSASITRLQGEVAWVRQARITIESLAADGHTYDERRPPRAVSTRTRTLRTSGPGPARRLSPSVRD